MTMKSRLREVAYSWWMAAVHLHAWTSSLTLRACGCHQSQQAVRQGRMTSHPCQGTWGHAGIASHRVHVCPTSQAAMTQRAACMPSRQAHAWQISHPAVSCWVQGLGYNPACWAQVDAWPIVLYPFVYVLPHTGSLAVFAGRTVSCAVSSWLKAGCSYMHSTSEAGC